ncbi:MAG: hypothetical protein SFV15_22825 [Polyangiaceae bacterium]|nr:hypothetical protein [Polyangiaceae bacterium]
MSNGSMMVGNGLSPSVSSGGTASSSSGGSMLGSASAPSGALGGGSASGGQPAVATGGMQTATGGRQVGGGGGSLASGGSSTASGGQLSGAGCTVEKMWAADFSEDPTELDINGDNVKDWRLRDGAPFPADELQGGVWHAKGARLLDTAPGNSFNHRVVVDVRLRHPGLESDDVPAAFWINVAGPNAPVVSVAAEVRHVGNSQRFRLSTLDTESHLVELYTLPGLADDLVEVHLEITPGSRQVKVSVAGVQRGTFQALAGGADPRDAFASLWSGKGGAEFGSVSVQLCTE